MGCGVGGAGGGGAGGRWVGRGRGEGPRVTISCAMGLGRLSGFGVYGSKWGLGGVLKPFPGIGDSRDGNSLTQE